MIESGKSNGTVAAIPFEGLWLATKPSGAIICARLVNGKLLMPYSFGNPEKLTGHYFDCRISDGKLCCRFEHFDSSQSGSTFLTLGKNETLLGGRWLNKPVGRDHLETSPWTVNLLEVNPIVWIRITNRETPAWAEKYFSEDWPNKF